MMTQPGAQIMIPLRQLDRILTLLIGLLLLGHIAGQFSEHILDHPNLKGLVPRFNMNGELSVATWYATLLLVLCAVVAAVIAHHAWHTSDRFAWGWVGLAALFTYAALDEGVAIHELTIDPLRNLFGITEGWLFFAWVIPAAVVVVVLAVLYRPMVRQMPESTRRGLLVGVGMLLAGGLGIEAVGGWYLSTQGDDFAYEMIGATEEVLELKGTVVVLLAFLAHIGKTIGDIRLSIAPT